MSESKKLYAVDTWTDLDDYGSHYVERKLYTSREQAERRAEEYSGMRDGYCHYAMVLTFEVVSA